MSFISSAFLWGGLLVSIPVIIHLFAKRRQVSLPWGAMQLLMSSKIAQRQRRMKLKDLLLLLIRMLMILLLSFLFARPFVDSPWLSNPMHDMIIVIDDSVSMSRAYNQDTSLFEEAKKRALQDINNKDQSAHLQTYFASSSLQSVDEGKLHALQARHGASNLIKHLKILSGLPLSESSEYMQIVLYTDKMKHSWPEKQIRELEALKEQLNKQKKAVHIQIVALEANAPSQNLADLAITNWSMDRYTYKKGEPFTVRVQVLNKSKFPSKARELEWKLNKNTVGKTNVSALGPGKTSDLSFVFYSEHLGQHVLQCSISGEDDLTLDNRAQAVVSIVDEIPLLIVSNQSYKGKGKVNDLKYLLASIGCNPKKLGKKGGHDLFKPRIVKEKNLSQVNFMEYHALIFLDIDHIESKKQKELMEYLGSGRNLWLITSEQIHREDFNNQLAQASFPLSPVELQPLMEWKEKEQGLVFASKTHPAIRALASNESFKIKDIHLKQSYGIDQDLSSNTQVLLRNSQGHPILVENAFSSGRVICQYFGLDRSWSDFSFSRFFVTYTNEIIWHMVKANLPKGRYDMGERFEKILSSVDVKEYRIIKPNGEEKVRKHVGERIVFNGTDAMGVYRLQYKLKDQKAQESWFVVGLPKEEQNLERLSQKDILAIEKASGFKFLKKMDQNVDLASDAKSHKPIDQFIAFLLMIFVIFEVLFAVRGLWRKNSLDVQGSPSS